MNMSQMDRTILVGVMMLLVAACGGSGETSSGSNRSAPPVVNLTSTTVTADSSVPTPVINAVAEVISPVASGSLSSSIQIATTGSHDSFVLALDAGGKIRLAAMSGGGPTTLNADSTALALVRMVIGVLPSGITTRQANQAIRGAAEFPALVGLIQGVLNTDLAPLESGPAVQSIATTTRQTMDAISAILAPPQSGGTLSVMAFAARPVTTPLPFKIVNDITSIFSVYVDSAGSGGSVNVVNASPIAWSAHSLNERGILIPAPAPSPDGKVLLEANTVGRSLLDKVNPWLGPPAINLPGNDGKGLDLVVEQTPDSREKNLEEVLEGVFVEALPFLVENGCIRGVARALVTADSLQALAISQTIMAFRDDLVRAGGGKEADLRGVISKCSPSLTPNAKEVGRFSRLIAGALTRLATGQVFDRVATLVTKIELTAAYWNTPPRPVAVCMGSLAFTGSSTIQNCVKEFRFTNPTPVLVPNARFTPRITALAAGNVPTGLPTGMTHVSSDTAQAVVTVLTPRNGERQTGELVANGVGSATITIRDPFTDVSEPYTVTVVRPIITPGVVRMGVGQAMTVSLTDANGGPVITDGSGLTWTLENERRDPSSTGPVAVLGPFSGGATNTASILARGPGKVTLTVRIPVLVNPITAEVEVSGISGTWQGSFSNVIKAISAECTYSQLGTLTMDIVQNGTTFSGAYSRNWMETSVGQGCGLEGTLPRSLSGDASGALTTVGDLTTLTGKFKISSDIACGPDGCNETWTATHRIGQDTIVGSWLGPYNLKSSSFTLTRQ